MSTLTRCVLKRVQITCQLYLNKAVVKKKSSILIRRKNTEKYQISHNSIRADQKQHRDVFLPVFSLYTNINNIRICFYVEGNLFFRKFYVLNFFFFNFKMVLPECFLFGFRCQSLRHSEKRRWGPAAPGRGEQ